MASWQVREAPATEAEIAALTEAAPFVLPPDYLELLSVTNGGEGELFLGRPEWFQIWPAQKARDHNAGYKVGEYHPGFWGFGSNGGGLMYAFRDDGNADGTVFGLPFDSIDPRDIDVVTTRFREFLLAMGRPAVRAV